MKTLIYTGMILCLVACNRIPPGSFKLEGSIKGGKDSDNILLYYYSIENGEVREISDTAKVINGKFLFEGNIGELTSASLCFDDTNPHAVIDTRMYLEPTTMKLRIDKNQPYTYELSGTKVEKENIELRKELESDKKIEYDVLMRVNEILKQMDPNSNNNLNMDSLINLLQDVKEHFGAVRLKMDSTYFNFIQRHNTYQIVPDLLYLLIKSEAFPGDTLKYIYNNLPEQSKTGLLGKLAFEQIESLALEKEIIPIKSFLIGKPAPDFTKTDFSGKTIRLSDFNKKNFVLLDFWASWCIPCVEGISTLKNIYNKYGEKGLSIISISIDSDSSSWLKALNAYHLDKWPQILNGKDDVASKYNVEAIPHFTLIDKQGKVVIDGVSGDQLITIDKILEDNIGKK